MCLEVKGDDAHSQLLDVREKLEALPISLAAVSSQNGTMEADPAYLASALDEAKLVPPNRIYAMALVDVRKSVQV